MDDEENDLFAIEVSSSDESTATPKVARDHLSEAAYQALLSSYTPKIESGNIHETIELPRDNATKQEQQTMLHAVEELYFFRRYAEADELIGRALAGKGLHDDLRKTLEGYAGRCKRQIN